MIPGGVEGAKASIRPEAPANEDLLDDFDTILSEIRAEAIYAKDWLVAHNAGALSAPLTAVVGVLSAHNLVVSDELGEKGFEVAQSPLRIVFNRHALTLISETIRALFKDEVAQDGEEHLDALVRQGIRLYVFHEVTHIKQQFIEHGLAKSIKRAFTPDELGKIDLVADVSAAHCNAAVLSVIDDDIEVNHYLERYLNSLLLSYELLTRAFLIKDADHKRKRALGLLTGAVLTQVALRSEGSNFDKYLGIAIRPAYTSVDKEDGCVVGLTCGQAGWEVLFHAKVRTNKYSVAEMWEDIGRGDPADIMGFLTVAYLKGTSSP